MKFCVKKNQSNFESTVKSFKTIFCLSFTCCEFQVLTVTQFHGYYCLYFWPLYLNFHMYQLNSPLKIYFWRDSKLYVMPFMCASLHHHEMRKDFGRKFVPPSGHDAIWRPYLGSFLNIMPEIVRCGAAIAYFGRKKTRQNAERFQRLLSLQQQSHHRKMLISFLSFILPLGG